MTLCLIADVCVIVYFRSKKCCLLHTTFTVEWLAQDCVCSPGRPSPRCTSTSLPSTATHTNCCMGTGGVGRVLPSAEALAMTFPLHSLTHTWVELLVIPGIYYGILQISEQWKEISIGSQYFLTIKVFIYRSCIELVQLIRKSWNLLLNIAIRCVQCTSSHIRGPTQSNKQF